MKVLIFVTFLLSHAFTAVAQEDHGAYVCEPGPTTNWGVEYPSPRGRGVGQVVYENPRFGGSETDCMEECESHNCYTYNYNTITPMCRCYSNEQAAAITLNPDDSKWEFCRSQEYVCEPGPTTNWGVEYRSPRGRGVGQVVYENPRFGGSETDCMEECESHDCTTYNYNTITPMCRCYSDEQVAALTLNPDDSKWEFCTAIISLLPSGSPSSSPSSTPSASPSNSPSASPSSNPSASPSASPSSSPFASPSGSPSDSPSSLPSSGPSTSPSVVPSSSPSSLPSRSPSSAPSEPPSSLPSSSPSSAPSEPPSSLPSSSPSSAPSASPSDSPSSLPSQPSQEYVCEPGPSTNWGAEHRSPRGRGVGQVVYENPRFVGSETVCMEICESHNCNTYNYNTITPMCRCYSDEQAPTLTLNPSDSKWEFCTSVKEAIGELVIGVEDDSRRHLRVQSLKNI